MELSPSADRVYVGGYQIGQDNIDGTVVAYRASDGAEQWRSTISSAPFYRALAVYDVAASPDGQTVFAGAISLRTDDDGDVLTHHLVAINAANGERLWSVDKGEAAGLGFGRKLVHVQVSPDSSVVYLVRSVVTVTDQEYYDFEIDARDGESGAALWTRRYAAGGLVSDVEISPSDGSRLYVTGTDDTGYAWCTLAVTSGDGSITWTTFHRGSGMSVPRDIAVAPDGASLALTGREGGFWTYPPNTMVAARFRTVLLDSGGEIEWSHSNEGAPVRNVDNEGYAVTFSPDSRKVYATGTSGYNHYVTIAYDRHGGEERWIAVGGDFLGGYPQDIGTSPDGNRVYVTGRARPGLGQGETRSYDATTGVQLWMGMQYESEALDNAPEGAFRHATDLAVGGDGRVYLLGFSARLGMVTYAYEG